ncbi:MAG: hypothetical protein ABL958_09245, partial [Bdellovibrionia bacterium]
GNFLYVGDGGTNQSIRKINLTTAEVTTVAGGPTLKPTGVDAWSLPNYVPVTVETQHPYGLNLNTVFPVGNHAGMAKLRVHFTSLEVESGDGLEFLDAAGAPVSWIDWSGTTITRINGNYGVPYDRWSPEITVDAFRARFLSDDQDPSGPWQGFAIDGYVWGTATSPKVHIDDLPIRVGDIPTMVAEGNILYFTDDTNNTVRSYDTMTGQMKTISGEGGSDYNSYLRADKYESVLTGPRGIAVTGDVLTVLDSRQGFLIQQNYDSVVRINKVTGDAINLVETSGLVGEVEADTDGDLEGATLMDPMALIYHPNRGLYMIGPTVIRLIH